MSNTKYTILAVIHGGGAFYCFVMGFLDYFDGNMAGAVSWGIAGLLCALTGPSGD